MATFSGTSGNDSQTGTIGADDLYGAAGNNSLDSGAGGDSLLGGSWLDIVSDTALGTAVNVNLQSDAASGGDVLTTQGPEAVIWAGHRRLEAAVLDDNPDRRPIHFPSGAIGNATALRLSTRRAVLMQDAIGAKVLVRAKHLAEISFGKTRVLNGAHSVCYHHILLRRHSVICAAGALTKSFYPGHAALAMLDWPARKAISSAILAGVGPNIQTVRPNLTQIYGEWVHPLLGRKFLRRLCPANSVADLTPHLAIAVE